MATPFHSSQPKSATGEWTAESVKQLCNNGEGGFFAIANSHNAELAAEREKVQTLVDALEDNDRWQREVLTDFRIEFDDHKIGRRLAFTQWMNDALAKVK